MILGILPYIIRQIRSPAVSLAWWTLASVVLILTPTAPVALRVGAAVAAVGLVSCIPDLFRRSRAASKLVPVYVGNRHIGSIRFDQPLLRSPTQYALQMVIQTVLIIYMAWLVRGNYTAWFFYVVTTVAIGCAAFELSDTIRLAARVKALGFDRVASDMIVTLMAKDPSDPFRKVRGYCGEFSNRTNVHHELTELIADRSDRIMSRLKEFQRKPNG